MHRAETDQAVSVAKFFHEVFGEFLEVDPVLLGRGTIDAVRPAGGMFFTCCPISPADYRRANPGASQARISIEGRNVLITDDYGDIEALCVDGASDDWWSALRKSIEENELNS